MDTKEDIRARFERFRLEEREQEEKIKKTLDAELPSQLAACQGSVDLLHAEALFDGLNTSIMDTKGRIVRNDGILTEENAKLAVSAVSLLWDRSDRVAFSKSERRFNRYVIYAHGERAFFNNYEWFLQHGYHLDPKSIHCGITLRASNSHSYPDLWDSVVSLPYRVNDSVTDYHHTFELDMTDPKAVAQVREQITEHVFHTLETKRYLFNAIDPLSSHLGSA